MKLHSYQQKAVDWMLRRLFVKDEQGVGLFADPGLGKTLMTLTLLQQLKDLGVIDKVLVVAPLRVCKLVWGQEVTKWGFKLTTNMLCQKVKAGLKKPVADIEIINPESLHLLADHCHRWDVLICDESTKFKNWTSKRMKALRKMIPEFKKRVILTGTPTPNSLADLHAQVFILDEGKALGKNITVFRSLYCYNTGWQGRKWEIKSDLTDRIQAQVAPLCLRLDASTCLDMPTLVLNDIICELPVQLFPVYKQLKRDLLAQLESGDVLAQNAASAYMKMRQFANGRMYDENREVHHIHDVKLEALSDLIEELYGKPLLIFYHFGHDLEALKSKFPKISALNGKTKAKDADKLLEDWNAGKLPLLACQIKAGSHGLNMQGCSNHVAYYGLGDSLEDYEQSYRRVYRQGVIGKQVTVHRLLMEKTVDEVIQSRLECKDQSQKSFLNKLLQHAKEGI